MSANSQQQITHTPGPWQVTEGSPAWIGYGVEANAPGHRPKICSIGPDHVFDMDKPSPIAEANARLIAAAPDMLEVLRMVQEYGNSGETDEDVYEFVDAVIRKAAGEVA